MKLKKITIHNIASIEDAVIDFEVAPLCEESRFLICGPTGSGKSTLLDAISLALFGTTPRLENAANESYTDKYDNFKSGIPEAVRTDDPRMLMRRGALDASAELLFTDKDGRGLKSVWSCRRARGKSDGTIQDWNLVLYDSDGAVLSNRKSETKRLIMERIGLSFEQFCRTTMLAQGDFTRFLKSNESEKSEILEKLTGTEIYSSISKRIHEVYTDKERILRGIQAQVDNAVLLAPEEKEKIISKRQDLVNEIGRLKVKERYLSGIRDWLKKSKDIDTDVLDTQNELNSLKVTGESLEFITKKKLVEDWDRSENIRMLRNRIARQKGIITTKENSEKEAQRVYECIIPGVVSFENSLKKVKEQKTEADLFLESESDKRELYAQEQLIENCIRQIMADNADIDRLQRTVQENQKNQEKYRLELSTHENQLESLNNQMERINGTLSERMNILTDMNYEEMLVRRHEVAEKVKELKLLKELYEKYSRNESDYNICKNKVERGKEDIAAYKSKLKSVKDQERVAQENLSSLRSLYNKQKLGCDDLIKEYRSRLAEGDTCPLCGQIIHNLIRDKDFQSILAPTEERLNTLQTESDKIYHLVADVNARLKSAEDARKEEVKECEKCYKAYSDSIKEYEGHPLYGQYASCPSPMETLNSDIKVKEELEHCIELDFSKYGRISNEVSSIQNEKEAYSLQLEKCNATITGQKDHIKDCQHTIDQSREGIERNRKRIEENRSTLSKYAVPDVCMERGEKYIEALQQAARRFNEITQKSRKLGEQVIQMTSDMEQIRNSMDSIQEIHPDWKISLQNCPDVPTSDISPAKLNLLQVSVVADHTFLQNARNELMAMEEESQRYFCLEDSLSLERIEELLTKSDTEEINETRNYLKNFEINFSTVGNKLENLKKDQKEHEALRPEMKEVPAPEIIQTELDETEKAIDLYNRQLGIDDERLQQDENNRIRYENICMNLENARQEFERWTQLHTWFGSADGKKFRNIAQSYILAMLLHSANYYLNSFSERYEMVCEPESLTILLKDKAAGGVVRPSTTISGGESFLVSLSLALGLSSLSRASISMDTLFIDEGFGTLDSTCLSTVMDALERLHRMNGKRIGIISHVDSLRERIPAQIQLTRVNSTLSRVEVRNLV